MASFPDIRAVAKSAVTRRGTLQVHKMPDRTSLSDQNCEGTVTFRFVQLGRPAVSTVRPRTGPVKRCIGARTRGRSGGFAVLFIAAAVGLAACADSNSSNRSNSSTTTKSGDPGHGTTTAQSAVQSIDPSYFGDGSCLRYQPASGNRHITVFLDAGHGGIDPGALGTTESGQRIYEGEITLPVELDTMALLRTNGFTVVVSRTRNTTVLRLKPADIDGNILSVVGAEQEVAARDICANDAHANLLVGIYMDAGGSSSSAGSVTAYDAVRPFSNENLRFAQLLQSSVVAAMNRKGWQIPNAGVLNDAGLGSSAGDSALQYDHLLLLGPAMNGYFTTPSEMPGALIEPLFITDPFEGSIADNVNDQHVVAGGIATAVEEYFSSAT
jgi:N-acetylmuramoyl-L-alanine amidase